MLPQMDKLEEMSGGRIKVERYMAGSVVTARQEYEGVLTGLIDIGRMREYTPGAFTLLSIGVLPYAGVEGTNVSLAMNEMVAKGYMEQGLKGLKFLTAYVSTPYVIVFKDMKPEKMTDMKGVKVRSPGAMFTLALEAMGAVAVPVTAVEVYDAYSRGLFEGALWTPSAHVDYNTYEISKYLWRMDAQRWASTVVGMNGPTFQRLPEDLKAIVEEVLGPELARRMVVDAYQAYDKVAYGVIEDAGIEVYSFSDSEKAKVATAVIPVWEAAIADFNAKGMPGKQIMTDYVTALKALGENPPWTP
jgi:TRAP-type C4-dicarboxylate transport system substrate-binding protein